MTARFLKKWLHASIPSECGMLVYKAETSHVTNMEFLVSLISSMSCNRCFVSLMYDGVAFANGFNMWSTYLLLLSVGLDTADIIGRFSQLITCIVKDYARFQLQGYN